MRHCGVQTWEKLQFKHIEATESMWGGCCVQPSHGKSSGHILHLFRHQRQSALRHTPPPFHCLGPAAYRRDKCCKRWLFKFYVSSVTLMFMYWSIPDLEQNFSLRIIFFSIWEKIKLMLSSIFTLSFRYVWFGSWAILNLCISMQPKSIFWSKNLNQKVPEIPSKREPIAHQGTDYG